MSEKRASSANRLPPQRRKRPRRRLPAKQAFRPARPQPSFTFRTRVASYLVHHNGREWDITRIEHRDTPRTRGAAFETVKQRTENLR
jgi:hypothetical protein